MSNSTRRIPGLENVDEIAVVCHLDSLEEDREHLSQAGKDRARLMHETLFPNVNLIISSHRSIDQLSGTLLAGSHSHDGNVIITKSNAFSQAIDEHENAPLRAAIGGPIGPDAGMGQYLETPASKMHLDIIVDAALADVFRIVRMHPQHNRKVVVVSEYLIGSRLAQRLAERLDCGRPPNPAESVDWNNEVLRCGEGYQIVLGRDTKQGWVRKIPFLALPDETPTESVG